ncbi:hypothetical protein PAXRUDRAFT_407811 [Paxillus rubicundulus Ve08.2h10]|uniref:Uncharacterized protein n=1 Tax=Paxillus rubicundulus Ve08.2h10 TaxID=930991 RepID=A0A0D0DQX0_9AGAM|nr:hypothetical protein PAXRUDRAFT_407811 [Paxillus rubicundulus Ve08.2h10]
MKHPSNLIDISDLRYPWHLDLVSHSAFQLHIWIGSHPRTFELRSTQWAISFHSTVHDWHDAWKQGLPTGYSDNFLAVKTLLEGTNNGPMQC